eukprot:667653-Prymnesium_polylepis.1
MTPPPAAPSAVAAHDRGQQRRFHPAQGCRLLVQLGKLKLQVWLAERVKARLRHAEHRGASPAQLVVFNHIHHVLPPHRAAQLSSRHRE